jgi:hypothetical protein
MVSDFLWGLFISQTLNMIDWCLTSSEQFFSYIQDENIKKFKRHGTRNKERWWLGRDNLARATDLLWTTHHIMSIMLIMSCYTGFFNVRRGWQSLNTGPRFYLRLIWRTGWLWIYTSRTTDGHPFKPKKLSVPFLYPVVPTGLTPFRGLVSLGRRNLVPILPPAHPLGGGQTHDWLPSYIYIYTCIYYTNV